MKNFENERKDKITKKIKTFSKEEKKQIVAEGISLIKGLGKKLNKHTELNKKTDHINYKICHLLYDPFTYINAYAKISKNKGALTKGHQDENTMQLFGLVKAKNIAKKIQKGEYQFKPTSRTWIPKPGKKKKRPIDVPTQSDRIVQEAIRGILEAIYEPEFQEHGKKTKDLSNNYGFRPRKSCWSAIEKLQLYSRGCNIIIEGDIVSAYNNVNHKLLLKILRRRIKDKKFLMLIDNMLKSGVIDDGKFEHNLNGTPQGGIVSPLLFNIYMLEFDRYVYEEIITPVLIENEGRNSTGYRSKKYNQVLYHEKKARKEFVKARNNHIQNGNDENKKKKIETRKEFKKIQKEKMKTPYAKIGELKKGAIFVRYADDWVLAMTCSKKEALITKEKISNYLKNYLKMELDTDKTKITRVERGYTFLGFEIRRSVKNPRLKRVLQKNTNKIYQRNLRRTTSRQLTIEPHSKRILERLLALKMCKKDYTPIAKLIWSQYDEFQIVQKYALIMRGIYNYYRPCERLSRLNHISYILQYSCAKTIAFKKKISMPQVIKRYGIELKIERNHETTKGETKKRIQKFYDLTHLKKMDEKK